MTTSSGAGGNGGNGVRELIAALQTFRDGTGEVPAAHQAIIEEHAELTKALRGPDGGSPGPVITRVDPLAGAPGDKVTIKGERLRDATLVRIGAGRIAKFFSAATDTGIVVQVPVAATSGEVMVFTPLGVATSGDKFEVVQTATAAKQSGGAT
jgi:hypothetical protein